jgi:prepilin-type processing-associated H-X9-DG protein
MWRLFLVIAVGISLGGCRSMAEKHDDFLPANEADSRDVLLKRIPIGSRIELAEKLLSGQGFECSRGSNRFGTYLYCDGHRSIDTFVTCRWQITIYFEEERVRDIFVSTGLIGM